VLALVISYRRATTIAAFVGQGLAIVFILAGLKLSAWLLMIIGVFIFLGAEGEERMVQMRSLLRDLDVEDVMSREFVVLAPTDDIARGLEMVYQTGQDDFPVIHDEHLLGIVSRQAMLEAVNRGGARGQITGVMETDVPSVSPEAKVLRVQDELFNEGWSSVPVMQESRIVGLLSPENISRYLLVQSSIKPARRPAAARTSAPPPAIAAVPPFVPPPPRVESVPPAGPV
jgi:predicted transcriptional regulator